MSRSRPAPSCPPGGKKLVEVDGRAIAVFNVDGAFHAIDDVCTHDGGPLAEGELIGCEIECPRHGARFDVRTGRPLCMPASSRWPSTRSTCAATIFTWRSMTDDLESPMARGDARAFSHPSVTRRESVSAPRT